jgi:hypothetical protein
VAFTFNGSVPSPIALGNDATTQNLFAITNTLGSRVNVYVRRLVAQLDPILGLTSVMPQVKISRATGISGGVALSPTTYDTAKASSSFVEVRSPMLDGFPLSGTAGTTIWQKYCSRMQTAAEQVLGVDKNILPNLVDTHDFILRPNQSILCQMVGTTAAANAALSNNWFVEAEWEEEAVSTFAISGTVTLSGSPVSGAIVTVIEADDESMTNPVLVETVTTAAGGTWASSISTGKVGAAFVQYKAGATYYTAPGSPYLS